MTALQQSGVKTSQSIVVRAMRKGNLLHKNRRNPDDLTKVDKKTQRHENVLQRDFTATWLNEKWLTDITQVSCSDRKLYIAPFFDCFGAK